MLRKQVGARPPDRPEATREALDVAALATVLVSSEAPGHPIEHAFDGRRGPGASRWVAADPGEQTVELAFDAPQLVRRLSVEIEETHIGRTQELAVAVSVDGGVSYREVLRQEYVFSPPGTSFEREAWTLGTPGVTHLRLAIRPDKGGGPSRASLTAMVLE